MSFISRKYDQFTYFATQLNDWDWRNKKVLDFGGNVGNILHDPNSTIDQSLYCCLDVGNESVEQGRQQFPLAKWVHYDRYCYFFNPKGVKGLSIPEFEDSFDAITAYSVFTNNTLADMVELVSELRNLLQPDGVFAFTFIDPFFVSWPAIYSGGNLEWRIDREIVLESEKGIELIVDREGIVARSKNVSRLTLVNGNELYIEDEEPRSVPPEQQRTFHTFYTESFMRTLFPDAEIMPPANNEMQHCCVFRNR